MMKKISLTLSSLLIVFALLIGALTINMSGVKAKAENREAATVTSEPDKVLKFTANLTDPKLAATVNYRILDAGATTFVNFAEGDYVEYQMYGEAGNTWAGVRVSDDTGTLFVGDDQTPTAAWVKHKKVVPAANVGTKADSFFLMNSIAVDAQRTQKEFKVYYKNIVIKDSEDKVKFVVFNNTMADVIDPKDSWSANIDTTKSGVTVVSDPLFTGTLRTDKNAFKVRTDLGEENVTKTVNYALDILIPQGAALEEGDYFQYEIINANNLTNAAYFLVNGFAGTADFAMDININLSRGGYINPVSWGIWNTTDVGVAPDIKGGYNMMWTIPHKDSATLKGTASALSGTTVTTFRVQSLNLALTNYASRYIDTYYKSISIRKYDGTVKYNIFDGSQTTVESRDRNWGEDPKCIGSIVTFADADVIEGRIDAIIAKSEDNSLSAADSDEINSILDEVSLLSPMDAVKIKTKIDAFNLVLTTTAKSVTVKNGIKKPEVLYNTDLDLSGMTLTLNYFKGAPSEGVAVTEAMLSGYDKTNLGNQNITITYKYNDTKPAVTTGFTVNVVDEITEVTLKTAPTKTAYLFGESFESGGATLQIVSLLGTNEKSVSAEMISGFNGNVLGEQTVKIAYSGVEFSHKITVSDYVVSVSLNAPPAKLYYIIGESLDISGLKLITTTASGIITEKAVTSAMVSGFDSDTDGTKTVKIVDGNNTFTFNVDVAQKSSSVLAIVMIVIASLAAVASAAVVTVLLLKKKKAE